MIEFYHRHQGSVRTFACLFLFICMGFRDVEGRIIYSKSPGGSWTSTGSWATGIVPIADDTVVIQSGHTITVASNLYSNSTYMFLVIVGTLDLSNNGKMSFSASSKVIIETGGMILGDGNSDQLSIGTGTSEYRGGVQGNISGPAYINNGHSPSTGEGTGGCGCYTPGSIPLPVKFIYFMAELQGEQVNLRWATSMEEDFEKFIIERSSTGLIFSSIGEIQSTGRNIYDIETKYSYTDGSPLQGFTYYRLKAVDLDGSFEYFDVRVVKITRLNSVSVYPNPTTGKSIFFRLNFNPSERDHIVVINSLGVEIARASVRDIENLLDLDNALSPGVYFLKYESPDFESTTRISVPE